MKRKRRLRGHGRGSAPPYRGVDEDEKRRRDYQAALMVLSLLLLVTGGLTIIGAIQAAASARRFSGSAIHSAADLRGSARGQAVILGGSIDRRTAASAWGLATYECERLEVIARRAFRIGATGPDQWIRCGARAERRLTW